MGDDIVRVGKCRYNWDRANWDAPVPLRDTQFCRTMLMLYNTSAMLNRMTGYRYLYIRRWLEGSITWYVTKTIMWGITIFPWQPRRVIRRFWKGLILDSIAEYRWYREYHHGMDIAISIGGENGEDLYTYHQSIIARNYHDALTLSVYPSGIIAVCVDKLVWRKHSVPWDVAIRRVIK